MFTSILLRLVTLWHRKVPPTGGIFLWLSLAKAVPCIGQGTAFSADKACWQPLISPSAANNEALAAALQNKPAPAPEASFHWPYAQRENPSAPSDRCTQTSRRHSTIYNTPH